MHLYVDLLLKLLSWGRGKQHLPFLLGPKGKPRHNTAQVYPGGTNDIIELHYGA